VDFLPIFFDIKQKSCLVIGGGEVAARKVSLLLKAQAEVSVVSPELSRELAEWRDDGKIVHIGREFEDSDIEKPVLVIAATDNSEVNKRASELAKARVFYYAFDCRSFAGTDCHINRGSLTCFSQNDTDQTGRLYSGGIWPAGCVSG